MRSHAMKMSLQAHRRASLPASTTRHEGARTMPEAPPAVAVHLGTHRPTVRAVREWCGTHRGALAAHHVSARTSWSALRDAVPGLDWRSDKGRDRLREHLTADGPVLFSSTAPLGPAYLPRG